MIEPAFNAFVEATTAQSRSLMASLKSKRQIYDSEKGRFGTIVRFDPIGYEFCDVEVVGSDVVFLDVPLLDLIPHQAFRFRSGQRIHIDGWIGIVTFMERKVKVKCANGQKYKFRVQEESAGTFDSYMSNGKLPTWCDRIRGTEDIYSKIDNIPYPGSEISSEEVIELKESNGGCYTAMKDLYYNCAAFLHDRETHADGVVRKVKITKIDVEWESAIDDRMSKAHREALTCKEIVQFAEVLAPQSQEACEEGSFRMYAVTGREEILSKNSWFKKKLEVEGAPRSITVDEVDKPLTLSEWQKNSGCNSGDEIAVKVLCRKRLVEVSWDNKGGTEMISLSDVAKMIPTADDDAGNDGSFTKSTEALYEVNINSDDEDEDETHSEGSTPTTVSIDPSTMVVDCPIYIPWMGKQFGRKDFVVDALRTFPSDQTVYGLIKSVNESNYTAVVDWYEVDESFQTHTVQEGAEASVFDLIHLDEVLDPLFRIEWKRNRNLYGSDIVCSRFGVSDDGFSAGYFKEINDFGQVLATTDSSAWSLWPCEIERLTRVKHQTDDGHWVSCPNDFRTDPTLIKKFLPDSKLQQIVQKQIQRIPYPKFDCDSLENYPKLREMPGAPANHKYVEYVLEGEAGDSSFGELVQEELRKTLVEMQGKEVYFCTYKNHPELVSALLVGNEGSVFREGVFLFDIYFPRRFPQLSPKVDYVSYATDLSPVLHDARASDSIQLMMFLIPEKHTDDNDDDSLNVENMNMTISSSTEADAHNDNNGDDSTSPAVLQTKEKGQGDRPHVSLVSIDGQHNQPRSLANYISFIYDVLFTARPDEVFVQVRPENLFSQQRNEYYYFLLGKKLESLSNLLNYPYHPWAEFMELRRPKIESLVKTVENLIGSSTDYANKGTVVFLNRRIKLLKATLNLEQPVEWLGHPEELCSQSSSSSSVKSNSNNISEDEANQPQVTLKLKIMPCQDKYSSVSAPPVPPRFPPPPPPAEWTASLNNGEKLESDANVNVAEPGTSKTYFEKLIENKLKDLRLNDSAEGSGVEDMSVVEGEADPCNETYDMGEYCSSSSSSSL